jgi:hypothetical protein
MGLVNQVKMDEECAKLESEIQKSIIRARCAEKVKGGSDDE